MLSHSLVLLLNAIQVTLGVAVLVFLVRARELRAYWPLLVMAVWQALPYLVLLYVRSQGRSRMTPHHAYVLYFFTFWPLFALSAVASIILTYTIFDSAMQPLKGLQSLGLIMYRWAGAISLAMAIGISFVPSADGSSPIILAVSQLQRASAILILSLVTFVVFAIRPMGLSLRSRVFGASVGTMIVAATNMLEAAYMQNNRMIFGKYGIIQLISSCVAEGIWIYYFAVPEPKRKFILLPTTSPFHRWNQISELLGHDPGYVAIGGVPPDAFAAAEIEVFHRASAKMNALAQGERVPELPKDAQR